MRTRKSALRITKWLRRVQTPGPRIPFEAECAACADAQFKIKYDKRSEVGCHGGLPPYGPPDRDGYLKVLQREFDEHQKLVHPDEYAARDRREQD